MPLLDLTFSQETTRDTLTKIKWFKYLQHGMCFIMCHYSTDWFHTDSEQPDEHWADRLFCVFFFLSAVFGVAETLLSCFLPSLALKLANALLICVGHNTGKQGCFLLHHFLRINTFQQWLYWLRKRHVACVFLTALPCWVLDTWLNNVI